MSASILMTMLAVGATTSFVAGAILRALSLLFKNFVLIPKNEFSTREYAFIELAMEFGLFLMLVPILCLSIAILGKIS